MNTAIPTPLVLPSRGRDGPSRFGRHGPRASASARAEARSAALSVQIEALAEQQALATHDDEHDPEGVTIGFERAQLLGLRAGARKEISALDRAMSRLRAGTYGRRVNCGYVISDARLEALPAVETCLNCATRSRSRR